MERDWGVQAAKRKRLAYVICEMETNYVQRDKSTTQYLLGNQADAVIRWKFLEHFVSI